MGLPDSGKDLTVRGERLLQRGGNVLQQHGGRAHIHQQQGIGSISINGDKALAGQQVQSIRRGVAAPPDGVAAVLRHGPGQHFRQKKLTHVIVSAGGPDGVQSRQQSDSARRPLPDSVCQFSAAEGVIQPAGVDGPQGQKAQDPAVGAGVPQDAHLVPGVRLGGTGVLYRFPQRSPQGVVRLLYGLKVQHTGPNQMLVLGLPQVQAVAEDEILHRGVDEVGDVPPQVDVLPDAGGADVLQMGGELQLDDRSLNGAEVRVDLPALGVAGAAEDDVVQGVDGAGCGRRFIGRGVCHYVGTDSQIQLPPGEHLPQAVQVGGSCQVHGNVVGEQIHVEFIGHGHTDDLPPHQGRLGLFGPGEFIHRQVDLKAQVPDGQHDALVAEGEGVEGAGEERRLLRYPELEGAALDTVLDDEAVNVGESCGGIEEGQLFLGLFVDEEENFLCHQGEQIGFFLIA